MILLRTVAKTPALLLGVVAGLGVLAGCNPASLGITWPTQKDWHHEAFVVIHEIKAKGHLARQEVEERLGEPDAVVPGEAFIAGQKELDAFRAFKLRLTREPAGDARRLYDERWKTSTILVYDENSHYPWPIAGGWRAYLFQVRNGNIVAGWDTYPNWTPWKGEFWDDVRERVKEGGRRKGVTKRKERKL